MSNAPEFMNRKSAAHYLQTRWGLRCSAATLAKLACQKKGPQHLKPGYSTVLYTVDDLNEWASAKLGLSYKNKEAA